MVKQLYSFQISDPDAMSMGFACVAESLEEAQAKTRQAGYRDFLLLETRVLTGLETTSMARTEFSLNPILGPEWRPVVEAMAESFQTTKPGEFWFINWLVDGLGPDDWSSPYLQALAESDGSLLMEVGPEHYVRDRVADQLEVLHFLGWESPPGDRRLPNYLRFFEPGWNMWHVATIALQTLVPFLGITQDTLFMVGGHDAKAFDPKSRLTRFPLKVEGVLAGNAYGLPARKQQKLRETQTATSGGERGFLGRLAGRASRPEASNAPKASPRPARVMTPLFNIVPREKTHAGEYRGPATGWGAQYEWVWAAVSAFRSLADPPGRYPFPTGCTGVQTDNPDYRPYEEVAYWYALLALTTYRLGWTRPAWGFARYFAEPAKHRDLTMMFIRQTFDRSALVKCTSFAESRNFIELNTSGALDRNAKAPGSVRGFLSPAGNWHEGRFGRSVKDAFGDGDSYHLSMHINQWGLIWSDTSEISLFKTSDGSYRLLLETGEKWYAKLQKVSITPSHYGIDDSELENIVVDVTVERIGPMGRFRYSALTGLWFTCSLDLHLAGNLASRH